MDPGGRRAPHPADAAPPSGAGGLVEVELGDGFGVDRVEGGRLVEVVGGCGVLHRDDGIGVQVKCRLRRSPGRGQSWWRGRQLKVAEDGAGRLGVGEEGEDAHIGSALGAAEGEGLVNAGQELSPAGAGGGAGEGECGAVPSGVLVSVGRSLRVGSFDGLYVQPLASEGDDAGTEPCVGGEDAVVAVAVDPGRRDQPGEGVEELKGREGEEGTPVRGGTGWLVEHAADAGVIGPPSRPALDAQPVEGEGRSGAVAEEPLATSAIGGADADGSVEAEAAGALPGEHVVHGVRLEEAAAVEEAEDAALDDGCECGGVSGGEVGRLVEAHLAVLGLSEHAVEDHHVEVEVGVEGRAEAVEEGDRPDLRVRPGAGAAVAEAGADGAEQDPEYGAGESGVVVEEGADPLGDGEDPLADRERREDVVVQVRGDFHHPAGVAGGADAAALAREGDQALGGAVVTPDAGEAVSQDPAPEVGPEVVFDPARHAVAPGVGLGGPGEERLEVVLHDGVEGRGRRSAAAVDGGGAGGRGRVRRPVRRRARRGPGPAAGCGGAHAADGSA